MCFYTCVHHSVTLFDHSVIYHPLACLIVLRPRHRNKLNPQPLAFRPTNLQSEETHRRKKIRKQKKNIENYIYIYIRIYKNHVPKFPYVPVLFQNTRSFTWKLERKSFLCDRKSVLDNPSDSYASLQMRNAGFYPYSFFFLLSFFQCDAFS